MGWSIARALDFVQDRDWALEPAQGVVFLATAFATFIIAELIGGNGFIAAFVAGMVFGNTYRHDPHFIGEFMEGAGQILPMAAFFGFGAFLLPDGLAHMTPQTVILAICFLTFVRIVPIWLSLTGSGLPTREKLFLGWFGPRGLASILFTLIIMDEFDFPTEDELLACVTMSAFLSVFLHGRSANPLVRRLGKATYCNDKTMSKPEAYDIRRYIAQTEAGRWRRRGTGCCSSLALTAALTGGQTLSCIWSRNLSRKSASATNSTPAGLP